MVNLAGSTIAGINSGRARQDEVSDTPHSGLVIEPAHILAERMQTLWGEVAQQGVPIHLLESLGGLDTFRKLTRPDAVEYVIGKLSERMGYLPDSPFVTGAIQRLQSFCRHHSIVPVGFMEHEGADGVCFLVDVSKDGGNVFRTADEIASLRAGIQNINLLEASPVILTLATHDEYSTITKQHRKVSHVQNTTVNIPPQHAPKQALQLLLVESIKRRASDMVIEPQTESEGGGISCKSED